MSSFPRDLLRSLPPLHRLSQKPEDEVGIELSLGLSLNGRFGLDPSRSLGRSSSVAAPVSETGLIRTCSLPAESEEECRKRKEVQSLRRLEAKRKRSQKQRTSSSAGDRDRPPLQQQGSVGSQGSGGSGSGTGSSGVSSESDFQPQFHVAESEPKSPAPPSANASVPSNSSGLGSKAKGGVLEQMPFVFTKANGPEGKRVEGFLHRYGKGEEVGIVCVCHGSFLSPSEFVKHAGGGDVAHPMRHIVVLPSSLL